jgi:hypothetical protein
MNDILIFAFGITLGVIIGRSKTIVEDESLKSKIEELEKSIEYYKDLCKWHVEEKERLKHEYYIKE